jgi:sporulation protein YlmC with PRC-barrel domain
MIRTFLTTTALAALLATGAYAQTAPAPAAPARQNAAPAEPAVKADGSLASNIVGESVYNGTGDDAQNIGKVSDIVFDKEGRVQSVVIGVGGFLGVGAKNVAFDYGKLQWAEKNGDRWLVAPTTREELTAQQAFDTKPYEPATAPADGTTTPAAPVQRSDGHLASSLIGESVYNGSADDAENIGKVEDIVISKAGQADSLVIGVGGFLGVGAKHVAFSYGKAAQAEKNGKRWLVVEVNKEQLKALPDFDRKVYDTISAPSVAAGANAPAAVEPATNEAAKEDAPMVAQNNGNAAGAASEAGTDRSTTGAIDKSSLTPVPMGDVRSQDLVGTPVYGPDNAKVGKVGDIVMKPDKTIDAVIVDVGGFLGVGEKEVAMGMDNLKYMADKNGDKYLYTSFSKDQLEAQPAYDKGKGEGDKGQSPGAQPQQ